jgi:hypothetical protein
MVDVKSEFSGGAGPDWLRGQATDEGEGSSLYTSSSIINPSAVHGPPFSKFGQPLTKFVT